jgi:polygalacturonase
VIVKNNIVYHGHGGFTVGSEMSGGVRNIHISNCTFIGTDIGLRFKSTRGRGGVVENIYIADIDMINIPAEAISFNFFYEGKSPLPEGADQAAEKKITMEAVYPVTEETPVFRNIFMDHITVSNSARGAIFQGLPEMPLSNVILENSAIQARYGITMGDSEEMTLRNVSVVNEIGPAIDLSNCRDVLLDSLELSVNQQSKAIAVHGTSSGIVRVLNSNIKASEIHVAQEVNEQEVVIR